MMFRSTCDFPSFSVIAFSRVDRKRSIRTKTTSADMNLKLSFSLYGFGGGCNMRNAHSTPDSAHFGILDGCGGEAERLSMILCGLTLYFWKVVSSQVVSKQR